MRRCLLATGSFLLLCAHPARAAAPPIIRLDGVFGAVGTSARAMSADGTVVGGNAMGGGATVWTKNAAGAYVPQLLPRGPTAEDAFANAVNAAGLIAGYQVDATGIPTATLWRREGPSYEAAVLPLPDGAVGASAYAINGSGEVAGFGVAADGATFATLWQPTPGGYTARLLPDATRTAGGLVATAINDRGAVAGYGEAPGAPYVPVVWDGAGGRAVYVVKGAVATAINNNGVGAGVDVSGDDARPMVIAPFEGDYFGAALPIATNDGDGAANHLNDLDVIVGYAVDTSNTVAGHQAALWVPTDTYWDYLNLDTWFRGQANPGPTTGPRWILRDANFITAANVVVGDAWYDADGDAPGGWVEKSFILDVSTAVPEPAALPLLALLTFGRRRQR